MFNINYMGIMENFYSALINQGRDMCSELMDECESMDIQLEIKNEKDRYLLEGIFPGIKKQDIRVYYKDDYLQVNAKRNQVFSNDGGMSMVVISDSRNFVKNFYIPNSDMENFQISFEEYKLRLEIPKKYFIEENDGTIIDVEYENE